MPKYEKMQLSVSIGGAIFREGNIEDAIASADRQMYIAKNYKNMVVTEWDEKSKKKENKKLSGHSPCYFDDKSTIHTSRRPFESNYKILR